MAGNLADPILCLQRRKLSTSLLFSPAEMAASPKTPDPCATISTTGAPGDSTARNVYKPSESERKCPKTLVNKQKTTSLALRDQEAAGSNPVTPMRKTAKTLGFSGLLIFGFSGLTTGRTIDRSTFGETVFLFCSAPDSASNRVPRTGSGACLPYRITSSVGSDVRISSISCAPRTKPLTKRS